MKDEAKHRKLHKLLALSASSNPKEAESAMLKAKELMEKWGIRTIDYHEKTNSVDIVTKRTEGYTKRRSAWETRLASSIAGCFDASVVFQRYPDYWHTVFICSKSEGVIIIDLYIKLRRIISKMSKEFTMLYDGDSHPATLKKAYAIGLIETIRKRLSTLYSEESDCRDIVLVKKEDIQTKMEELFPNVKPDKQTPIKDKQAYLQGLQDGEKVSLNKSLSKGECGELNDGSENSI